MSQKAIFVSNFRAAVTAMLSAFSATQTLADHASALGWTEEDFESVLAGSDITAEEFYAGLEAVRNLRQNYVGDTVNLAKLAP